MLIIGLCYAEIATMYPVSGGEVAYLYEMYGIELSFFAGWFLALNYIALTAFEAISVGWLLSAMFPGIEGPVIYSISGTDVHLFGLSIGLVLMVLITIINFRGARSTAYFQDTLTCILLLASIVFIFAGIFWGDSVNLNPKFVEIRPDSGFVAGIIAVLATTPFWFSGFDTIPQAMGEKADGASLQLLPRVIALAIGLALLFYCLVILAATMSLPRAEMLALDLPAAGALQAAFNSTLLGNLVLFAGLCGLITSWNAFFYAGSRLIFALGRAYMIPPKYGQVHPVFGSPTNAILFVGVIGGALSFLGRNAVLPIVNVGATSMALVFLLVSVGVLRLRRTRPDHVRPYKVPGGDLIPALASLSCLVMLIIALSEPWKNTELFMPVEWMLLCAWGALGLVFWIGTRTARLGVNAAERHWLILNERS